MRGSLPIAIFAAIAFAGCVASPAATVMSSGPPATASIEASTGTSTISGKVVDDEQLPLSGVFVQIVSSGNATPVELQTADDGRFSLTDVPGGSYLVYASRLGYETPPAKRVVVAEGETVEVTMVLVPLAVVEPFQETIPYSTYFHWYVCVVTPAFGYCPLLVFDSTNSTKVYKAEEEKGELQSFIVETRWTSNIGACTQGMRSGIYSPEQTGITMFPGPQTGPYYWDNQPLVTSPTRVFIPREGGPEAMHSDERTEENDGDPIETVGDWRVQIFPIIAPQPNGVGVQCTLDQRVNAWITAFFEAPAPSDFSAILS